MVPEALLEELTAVQKYLFWTMWRINKLYIWDCGKCFFPQNFFFQTNFILSTIRPTFTQVKKKITISLRNTNAFNKSIKKFSHGNMFRVIVKT